MMTHDESKVDCVVIGAGAVGLAVALKLSKKFSSIVVLEKESRVGSEQSSRNSGVIHSGVYYDPGSKKARLCIRGNELLYKFSHDYEVPCAKIGKLIVANNQAEVQQLQDLLLRGAGNGVPDLRLLGPEEIKQREKNLRGTAALFVPTAGILDAQSYVERLRQLCKDRGIIILTNTKVHDICPDKYYCVIKVRDTMGRNYIIKSEWVINAAGLYADQIAMMINNANQWKIGPVRGEYVTFNMRRQELVINNPLVYHTPKIYIGADGKQYTSLGIHLTPTFSLNRLEKISLGPTVLIGPSVKSVLRHDDYETDRYPINHFTAAIADFFPWLKEVDCEFGYSGITARLLGETHDFLIEYDKGVPQVIHLVGIDSPGLTSSLSIADEVHQMII